MNKEEILKKHWDTVKYSSNANAIEIATLSAMEEYAASYAQSSQQQGEGVGRWIRANERLPILYSVNDSHEKHFRLDSRKVDGFFLHSQCFEYFDAEISGYRQLDATEFVRIEWLDESTPTASGNGEGDYWKMPEVVELRKQTGIDLKTCKKAVDKHPHDIESQKAYLRTTAVLAATGKRSATPPTEHLPGVEECLQKAKDLFMHPEFATVKQTDTNRLRQLITFCQTPITNPK